MLLVSSLAHTAYGTLIFVLLPSLNIHSIDIFENLSLSVKKERYTSPEDTLGEREAPSARVEVAEKQNSLYEVRAATFL